VLDDEGFFMLKGAVEALAEETGNTKYTIYSYLREVRGERSETPSELR
jgi:predicted transcriptional regulator YheO